MAITQAVCTSFKAELANKEHDMDTDVFYVALYVSAATLGAATTAYSATNETSGTGYDAGGKALTGGAISTDGAVVIIDFADIEWAGASFTAAGALIYNSSNANKAVAVLSFGGDFSVASGTFRIVFPDPDATNGLIRLN